MRHNAGTGIPRPIGRASEEDRVWVIDVNLNSMFRRGVEERHAAVRRGPGVDRERFPNPRALA